MELLNDVRDYSRLSPARRVYLAAFLTALAGILSVLDAMVPKPVPLAKIGLANLVTLVLLLEDRFSLAFLVAVLRTVTGGLMTGSFLSYTWLLSLSGSVVSVFGMGALRPAYPRLLSAVGLSVAGAFFSTAGQGAVVIAFFGLDKGTAALLAFLLAVSVGTGTLTGYLGGRFLNGRNAK
jgi:heptaprenyl diphosphate synthase